MEGRQSLPLRSRPPRLDSNPGSQSPLTPVPNPTRTRVRLTPSPPPVESFPWLGGQSRKGEAPCPLLGPGH